MIKMMYSQYSSIYTFGKKPFYFLRKEMAYGADLSHCQLFSTNKQTEENHRRLQTLIIGGKG